jgi:hypothetical protein
VNNSRYNNTNLRLEFLEITEPVNKQQIQQHPQVRVSGKTGTCKQQQIQKHPQGESFWKYWNILTTADTTTPTPVRVPGNIETCKQPQIQQHHPKVRVHENIGTREQQQIQQHHPQVRVPGNIGTCEQQQIQQHQPRCEFLDTLEPVNNSRYNTIHR